MPSLNPRCTKCPLHETAETVCLAGDGPKNAKVFFVGEAPGAEEDRMGKPFIGKSGQLLRSLIKKHGLNNVFITNTVRCRPPDNRTPSPQEIKACRGYLDEELKRVSPEFVVACGATAAKVLFPGRSKVTQHHGTIVDDPKKPYRGFVSYHPAFALRDPTKLPALDNDIGRLSRAVRGENRAPPAPWAILRRGNLRKFMVEFEEAPEFSFDLETSGYFMHNPDGYINAVSIDLPERTWVIPLMDFDPILKRRKYTPWRRGRAFAQLIHWMRLCQTRTNKRCVGHNGKFDNNWLRCRVGKWFWLTFDTMLASHALDENRDHDLKSLSRAILDAPEWDLTKKEKMGFVHPRKLYRYSAYDAYYTRRLKKYFNREFNDNYELKRLFYKLTMPVARAMEDVEMVGKTMNLEKMEDLALRLRSELVILENNLNKAAGRKLNWDSPEQVAKLLFEDLGLEPTIKTPKGKPSTSEEALFDQKGKHVVVDKLVDYREKSKFLGTYVYGLQELMIGPTLYVPYKIHGTVGGRFSSRFHSIPRDGSIRNLVEAPPGWKFWVADIQQAELRFAAHLSGDLEMRRCFKNGIDIHWRTVMFALGQGFIGTSEYVDQAWETAEALNTNYTGSIEEVCNALLLAGPKKCAEIWPGWKEARYRAKCINFGFVYGMYENKFIELAKTDYQWEPTWDEAHSMREGYFELYSGLPKWHKKEKSLCRLNGYAHTLSGRLRRLPAIYSSDKYIRSEAERQAVNIRVQSFIGDYKSMALIEIHERIDSDNAKLVGEHHDAVLGIVRDGAEEETFPIVKSVMKHPKLLDEFNVKLDIPMESEIQVGPYGAGKEWKAAA